MISFQSVIHIAISVLWGYSDIVFVVVFRNIYLLSLSSSPLLFCIMYIISKRRNVRYIPYCP